MLRSYGAISICAPIANIYSSYGAGVMKRTDKNIEWDKTISLDRHCERNIIAHREPRKCLSFILVSPASKRSR